MGALYDRVCIVKVQEVAELSQISIDNPLTGFELGYNKHLERISIEQPLAVKANFRIAFDVEKTSGSESNKAKITLWNMSATTRAQLEKDDLFITLKAGYATHVGIIFAGYITRTETVKQGADILTYLHCADGIKDIQEARISKTWKAGTPKGVVLTDILKTFKRCAFGDVQSLSLTDVLTSDFSVSGLSAKVMKEFEREYPFEFSIQDNSIQLLDYNIPSTKAVVLTPKTGLIGSPAKVTLEGDKRTKEQKDGVRFQALLIPALEIGAQAAITSDNVTGSYKLRQVNYSGDTHGQNWYADCEGVSLL